MRWTEAILWILLTVYLMIGAAFAILPFLFGAYKVAAIMLFSWPIIFLK